MLISSQSKGFIYEHIGFNSSGVVAAILLIVASYIVASVVDGHVIRGR